MVSGTTEDNTASLIPLAASELDDLVFSDHFLLDLGATSENISFWVVKGREDLGTEHSGKSLHTVEVSVLDDHDAGVSHQLLWVVVDELTVDEDVWFVGEDLVDLLLHLHLLCFFDLGHFHDGIDLDLGTKDLDLVCVHLGVGNHDLWVLLHLLTSGGNLLLQNETISEIRISKSASSLLDDLDVVQVARAFQTKDRLNGELSKLIPLRFQQLGAESGQGNVLEILAELDLVIDIVHADVGECLLGHITRLSPTLDDNLWVDFLVNQLVCLSQELTSKHRNSSRTIAHFLVLRPRYVYQNLCCRIVDIYRLQYSRTIIGHGNLLSRVLVAH